jgi:hypothetical protein
MGFFPNFCIIRSGVVLNLPTKKSTPARSTFLHHIVHIMSCVLYVGSLVPRVTHFVPQKLISGTSLKLCFNWKSKIISV